MTLQVLQDTFAVCQLTNTTQADLSVPYTFLSVTDDEISLVCPTHCVPKGTLQVEHGWLGCRIPDTLDFALVGILAKIATLLAQAGISIFAVSTYNTDYIFMKSVSFTQGLDVLQRNGYLIVY